MPTEGELVLLAVADEDGGHDEPGVEVAEVEEAALGAEKAVGFAANAGETVAAGGAAAGGGGACAG